MNYIVRQKLIHRERFFSDDFLESSISVSKKISIIVVVHLIDTGLPYINTLDKYFDLQSIIPKQKSIDNSLSGYFPREKILNIPRELIDIEPERLEYILDNRPRGNKIVMLDIGGYFSNIGGRLKKRYGNSFLGIIEDTENGYQKYLKQSLTYPVVSVARSLLKENEDYLVGQAVVFSAESLLREQGILINGKSIGIIGIGKIGNGILSSLKSKSSEISIFDTNPISLVMSYLRGVKIDNKLNVIKNSDILFLATGNLSLKEDEYKYLKNGTFLLSVTSSDDEIDIVWVKNKYKVEIISNYIKKYEKNGHYFFIVNEGNAVNFIHGAVVDDFILLVQKEMIDSIVELSRSNLDNKIHNGFENVKERIADSWLNKILGLNI